MVKKPRERNLEGNIFRILAPTSGDNEHNRSFKKWSYIYSAYCYRWKGGKGRKFVSGKKRQE